MSKLAQENLAAGVVAAIFCAFIGISLTYSAKAALVPVFVASVSLGLILIQLYLQNFRKDIKLNVDSMDLFSKYADPSLLEELEEVEGQDDAKKKQGRTKMELGAFGLVLLYVAMIFALGLIESTFLYVLGYFMFIGKYKWYQSLATAAITALVLNGLFGTLLGIRMYEGWLVTALFGS